MAAILFLELTIPVATCRHAHQLFLTRIKGHRTVPSISTNPPLILACTPLTNIHEHASRKGRSELPSHMRLVMLIDLRSKSTLTSSSSRRRCVRQFHNARSHSRFDRITTPPACTAAAFTARASTTRPAHTARAMVPRPCPSTGCPRRYCRLAENIVCCANMRRSGSRRKDRVPNHSR